MGGDTPTVLRALQREASSIAFWDGTHLFVGSGPRVLAWNGMPASPSAPPDFVLGQPDLTTTITTTSASLFGTVAVSGIWSDGTRLAVANGSRVLLWQQVPTQTLEPADIVLGQPDTTTNKPNTGGVSASSMSGATTIDSDGSRLYVADALNHRILVWTMFPTQTGQPADFVVGQPNTTSNAAYGGATKLYLPVGLAANGESLWLTGLGGPGLRFTAPVAANDPPSQLVFGWQLGGAEPQGAQVARPGAVVLGPSGGVGVRDGGLFRALFTRSKPTGPSLADYALGQPDTSRTISVPFAGASSINPTRVSASTLSDVSYMSSRSGTLVAGDDRRVLIWDKFPTYNFEPASFALGQAGTSVNERSDYRAVGMGTLAAPSDVASAGGWLAVADRGNNRVLLYKSADLTKPLPLASVVLGQPDAKSFVANKDQRSPGASTMSGPAGLCTDGTHLAVADTENHRVLLWNTMPAASGAPADIVLGQADFSGRRPNRGRGDVAPVDGFSDVGADGFFYPTGLACDAGHLFVADRLNHRVLAWDGWPIINGKPADRVLGQPTMTTVGAHRGAGAFTVVPDGFNLPTGLALVGSSLWVADTENNRVVRWDDVFVNPSPTAVLGQPDGTTITNPNYQFANTVYKGNWVDVPPPTTSGSVLRPRGIVVNGGRVFVSEGDSNRVHVFDAQSLAPVAVLGQPAVTSGAMNQGGVSAFGLADPMGLASDGVHLWVADARNHRVVGYALTSLASGMAASYALGQPTMQSSGFNATTMAVAGGVAQPRGLALLEDMLFIADTNNNRVLVRDLKADTIARVLGQPNETLALPNSGGSPSASTLNGPRGVTVDGSRLVVADTANHRVLFFDAKGTGGAATLVLGQTTFDATAPNSGGASAATLRQPAGSCSDGTRFVIADTGNNRLLLWNAIPTANGQPADLVLGQSGPADVLSNRGMSTADMASLSQPHACAFVDDALLVADTGNNRVLVFAWPVQSGLPARVALGQPDLFSRLPAVSPTDVSRLAGPVAIASDGPKIYVVDRDLSRVVAFPKPMIVPDLGSPHLLGGPNLVTLRPSGGVAVRRTPLFTSKLFLSETSIDRVVEVSSASRLLSP